MEKNSKIYVAGHRGLVGSAIVRKLREEGYTNIIYRTHSELDLTRQEEVEKFFKIEKPEYIFLAAAKVGGIQANSLAPADFIYTNLMIESNVIHLAYKYGVKKLLFLGSNCIYPENSPQPIKEEYLLSGKLEKSNIAYAISKIAGVELCKAYRKQYSCDFISAMPINLYGPNDHFDLATCHVLPAFIRKFSEAKENEESKVIIWGSGVARREFMYVDDLADALIFLMNNYSDEEQINIGSGDDISIRELAELFKKIIGFKGEIVFDASKPDGTLRKLLDCTKLNNLGWKPKINLEFGIKETYKWYLENKEK